jgi:hypothetical protein
LRRPETEVDVATIESTTEIRPFSVEVPEEISSTSPRDLLLRAAFRPLRTNND